jgi:hypothetical protein
MKPKPLSDFTALTEDETDAIKILESQKAAIGESLTADDFINDPDLVNKRLKEAMAAQSSSTKINNAFLRGVESLAHSLFSGSTDESADLVNKKIEKLLPYKSYEWSDLLPDVGGSGSINLFSKTGANVQQYLNREGAFYNEYIAKKYPINDTKEDEFDPTSFSTYKNLPYQSVKTVAELLPTLMLTGWARGLLRGLTGFSASAAAEKFGESVLQKTLAKGAPKYLANAASFGARALANAPVSGGSLFNYTYTQNINNLIDTEGYSIDDPMLHDKALKRTLVESSLEGMFDQVKALQAGPEVVAGLTGKKALFKQTAKNLGKEMAASGLEEASQSLATAPFDMEQADKKVKEIQAQIQSGQISPEEGNALIQETELTAAKIAKNALGEGIIGSITPVVMKTPHIAGMTVNNAESRALGHAIQNQDALDEYLNGYVNSSKTLDEYKAKQAHASKIKDFVGQVKEEYDYWTTNNATDLYQEATGRKVMKSTDAMKMGVQVAKLKSIAQKLTEAQDPFEISNLKGQAKLVAQSIKNINNGTDIGQKRVMGEEIAAMVAKTTPIGNFTDAQAEEIVNQPGFQQDVLSGAREFNRIVKNDPEVSQYVQDIEQGKLKIDETISGNPILTNDNKIIDGKKRFAKAFVDAKNSGVFEYAVTKAVPGKTMLAIAAASATEVSPVESVSPFSGNAFLDSLYEGVNTNFKIARANITNSAIDKPKEQVDDELQELIYDTVKELALSGVKYKDLSLALQKITGTSELVADGTIKYMVNENLLPNASQIKKALKEKAKEATAVNKEVGIGDELNLPKETRKKVNDIEKQKDQQIDSIPRVAEDKAAAKNAIKKGKNQGTKKEASILLNDPAAFYDGMLNSAIQLKLDLESTGQPTEEASKAVEEYTQVVNEIKTIEAKASKKKAEVLAKEPVVAAQKTTQEQTKPVGTSDIEAKKADIEKDVNGEFIPKKYTLNARGENPAPNISISAIDLQDSGLQDLTDVKQVKLLEIRGKNSEGKTVGKVWIQKKDGQSFDAEVKFNDAELAALNAKPAEEPKKIEQVVSSKDETGEIFATGTISGETTIYGNRPDAFGDRRVDSGYKNKLPKYFFEQQTADKKIFTLVDTTVKDDAGRRGFISVSISLDKNSNIKLDDVKSDLLTILKQAMTGVDESGKINKEKVTNALKVTKWVGRAKTPAEIVKPETKPAEQIEPTTPVVESEFDADVLMDNIKKQISDLETEIKTLQQEEVNLGTVEYKPKGQIVGYIGQPNPDGSFSLDQMHKQLIPGQSLYTIEETKEGYNAIPINNLSNLETFIDYTANTFDPLYNAAEDVKSKETGNISQFVSFKDAKYSSSKVTPTQPAQLKKTSKKGKMLKVVKKGIAFWGKPYEIKVKIVNKNKINELRAQQDVLQAQLDDVRQSIGEKQSLETGRAYKAKLNVMAKEIENNLTNIFDQMGVKRPQNLTPKCP